MVKYPPLQVFDENDRPIGQASLQEILAKGLIHRVVHVVVEDTNGKLLLQKRGPHVATNPNTWDFSAAGYVDAGETYDVAAHRELNEELSLIDFELKKVTVERESEGIADRQINRFAAIYKVIVPPGVSLTVEPSEVAEVRWYDTPAIKRLVEGDSKEITPFFADWLRKHYLNT